MKNVDFPLWDKGDDTDNFGKGGSSSRSSSRTFSQMEETDKNIKSAFKLAIGRKPTSRESAYYRISKAEKNYILLKLINTEEHKELISNGRKYPDLVKEKKVLEANVLKLKSNIDDFKGEYEQLKNILEQKNLLIKELREQKGRPYLTDKSLLETPEYIERKATQRRYEEDKEETLWDKILKLFFK